MKKRILVFGITRGNVVIGDFVEKILLLVAHALIQAASGSETHVVVRVGRVVWLSAVPVGFECFLNHLMTHESHIKPAFRAKHGLGCRKVIIGNLKPICNILLVHNAAIFSISAAKLILFFEFCKFFRRKISKKYTFIPENHHLRAI